MGQITGSPRKGDVTEKGETKPGIAAQRWFYDLQVFERLKSDNDPPLQPVRPNQISLDRYVSGDASKGGLEVEYPCPRKEVMVWRMVL